MQSLFMFHIDVRYNALDRSTIRRQDLAKVQDHYSSIAYDSIAESQNQVREIVDEIASGTQIVSDSVDIDGYHGRKKIDIVDDRLIVTLYDLQESDSFTISYLATAYSIGTQSTRTFARQSECNPLKDQFCTVDTQHALYRDLCDNHYIAQSCASVLVSNIVPSSLLTTYLSRDMIGSDTHASADTTPALIHIVQSYKQLFAQYHNPQYRSIYEHSLPHKQDKLQLQDQMYRI